ncbi:MAG: hypothetical protein LC729_02160 [Acidobacteria bacterium]|nr:hypothetical protein [Acidobacteriota bacterium]
MSVASAVRPKRERERLASICGGPAGLAKSPAQNPTGHSAGGGRIAARGRRSRGQVPRISIASGSERATIVGTQREQSWV